MEIFWMVLEFVGLVLGSLWWLGRAIFELLLNLWMIGLGFMFVCCVLYAIWAGLSSLLGRKS